MGVYGIDRSVQPNDNCDKDGNILVNVYQKINANNNTISAESRTFAENTIANIISLVETEELAAA